MGFAAYFRLVRAGWVLAREGALSIADTDALPPVMRQRQDRATDRASRRQAYRPVERLTRALNKLGPTYVKFGQTLATRPDIVGAEFAADLAVLQDKMEPFDQGLVPGLLADGAGSASRRPHRALAADRCGLDRPGTQGGAASPRAPPHGGGEGPAAGDQGSGSAPTSRAITPAARSPSASPKDLRRLRPTDVVRTLDRSARLELDLRLEAAVDLGVRRQHQE